MEFNYIKCGDCLELIKEIPDKSINCVVTSPPYEKYCKIAEMRIENAL